MSLLLDALKRAEEAKRLREQQEAASAPLAESVERAEPSESAELTPLSELLGHGEESPALEWQPLSELTLAEDTVASPLADGPANGGEPAESFVPAKMPLAMAEPLPPPAPVAAATPPPAASVSVAAALPPTPAAPPSDRGLSQGAAKALFASKGGSWPRWPNPLELGLALLAGGAVVGGFWYGVKWQLSRPLLGREPPVAAQMTHQETATVVAPISLPAAVSTTAAEPMASPRPAIVAKKNRRQQGAPAAGKVSAPPLPDNELEEPVLGIAPQVAAAYQAYRQGDLAKAAALYQRQLQHDPHNRDAQLGLAAIAWRQGNLPEARERYRQRLLQQPDDRLAQTALASLQQEPALAEEGLRRLAVEQADPRADFALGSHYARTGRWSEAQAAYFRAYSSEPGNADYAYNLAVSLDHLQQAAPARLYYRQALTAAAGQSVAFDRTVVEQRLQRLGETAP